MELRISNVVFKQIAQQFIFAFKFEHVKFFATNDSRLFLMIFSFCYYLFTSNFSNLRRKMGDHYGFSLTTFSPSGKLMQIEYALNAVRNGQPSVGLRGLLIFQVLTFCHYTLMFSK